MFARACRDIARFYRKSWWFSALMQLASGLLIAIPLTLIVQIATAIVRAQGAELAADDGISRFVIILLVVSIVVCLPVALVGLSATVRTINDSLAVLIPLRCPISPCCLVLMMGGAT